MTIAPEAEFRADDTAAPGVISASRLGRSFDDRVAVRDLDLEIGAGEVVALLGPNGAGKTTTVRLLNGVLAPDAGSSRVLGLDPAAQGEEVRRRTGVLTETAGLDDRLSTLENLISTARIRGIEAGDARLRAMNLLERFGVAGLCDQRTAGLSTGQRKRIALARALLHDPQVLFLDEPTSGLDPSATREVTDLIGSLARDRGRTILLCTHFLGEAGRIADRMAVLDRGRLHAIGRPDELAAGLWDGLRAEIDLGRPATVEEVAVLNELQGVRDVAAAMLGASLVVDNREALGRAISELVHFGSTVMSAGLPETSMEDVYFALEARIAATVSP